MGYFKPMKPLKFDPSTLLALLPKLLKFSVLILLLLSLIFSLRLCTVHSDFKTKKKATDKDVPKQKTETQQLFEELMLQKQLLTVKQDGRITLPAKDYILSRRVANLPIKEKEDALHQRLYYSIAGKAVQHQVKFWNHSRLFAAVRDNIPNANKKTATRWQVRNHWDEKPLSSDWVPLSYGYVNGSELRTGFNDWISVADRQALLFSADVTINRTKTISIQVIGQPDLSTLKGKKRLFGCSAPTKEQRKRGSEKGCQKVASASDAFSAYIIHLTLTAGRHHLKLKVMPAKNTEKRIDGLPIYITQNNHYAWEPVREYQRNSVIGDDLKYTFKLMTEDGLLLVNPLDSSPTRFARENGLVTLVGYEKSDRYALSG
jgi:hypothetical protein